MTEPGFRANFRGMPAHYQVKYRHEGQEPAGTPGYVVHVTGNNPRVNIQSTDNSTNSVTLGKPEDLTALVGEFTLLREALLKQAHDPEHYAAIGAVAAAEIAAKDNDASKVNQALATLGKGGRWVLGVAKDIGVEVAASLLKSQLGLPG